MTLARYIGGLTVTQGAGAGEPFRVLPWQRRFLDGFARTDGDVSLSISRGAGKSTLIAGLACATVDGPLDAASRRDGDRRVELHSGAESSTSTCSPSCASSGTTWTTARAWRLQDSSERRDGRVPADGGAGAVLSAADPARAHGLAPALVVADEPSAVAGHDFGADARRPGDIDGQD